MGSTTTSFKFPAFHSFPPSYTLQPVAGTRAKQTTLWCDLIRSWCRHHRVFWLDKSSNTSSELFANAAIARRLGDDSIRHILRELVARGDGEWDATNTRVLVYWRRPSEWAELIFAWIENTGQNGQVLTVHEIRNCAGQEFTGLELDTTMRALQALEVEGKCAIMEGDVNDGLVSYLNWLHQLTECSNLLLVGCQVRELTMNYYSPHLI